MTLFWIQNVLTYLRYSLGNKSSTVSIFQSFLKKHHSRCLKGLTNTTGLVSHLKRVSAKTVSDSSINHCYNKPHLRSLTRPWICLSLGYILRIDFTQSRQTGFWFLPFKSNFWFVCGHHNFVDLRIKISNTHRTIIKISNFCNISVWPVSKIILVLMPYSEYLFRDACWNFMIYMTHFSTKGSKISILNRDRTINFQ